jgi:hypothetical protein
LTDEARDRVFNLLIASALPNSSIRVSNAVIWVSRVSFLAGPDLARWLAESVEDPKNLDEGDGRDHARWEARKLADGSVKIDHRGLSRREDNRAA